jgi:hypothetical protein
MVAPELSCGVPGPWFVQAARKPDSVLDDHSSRRRVTAPLQQPTRKFRLASPKTPLNSLPWRIGPIRSGPLKSADPIPAYLVLLRVGFTMRRPLLAARCALTAPFHPYRCFLTVAPAVCFLLHWPSMCLEAHIPDVIRHTALRSPDFPPPLDPSDLRQMHERQRSPGRLLG